MRCYSPNASVFRLPYPPNSNTIVTSSDAIAAERLNRAIELEILVAEAYHIVKNCVNPTRALLFSTDFLSSSDFFGLCTVREKRWHLIKSLCWPASRSVHPSVCPLKLWKLKLISKMIWPFMSHKDIFRQSQGNQIS